jgi:hypothetical protein
LAGEGHTAARPVACEGLPRAASLPGWLGKLAQLDVSGCDTLAALSEGPVVTSWIELGDSGLTALPASLAGIELRWQGVRVDERIAFRPETITAGEILATANVELRRVMLGRVGYPVFLEEVEATLLDSDYDAGGERRLMRVRPESDEPQVCISVFCPSTGRQYVLRVPPTMRSCRQAVAWTASFDNPDDYRPLIES